MTGSENVPVNFKFKFTRASKSGIRVPMSVFLRFMPPEIDLLIRSAVNLPESPFSE